MKKSLISGALCFCATGLGSISASASVVYTYTGNTFTNIHDSDPPAGSFTTSDSVSFSFVVPALLTGYSSPTLISPASFTASNGRATFTETSPLTVKVIHVKTDSSGSITGWHINLVTGDASLQLGEQGEGIYTGFNTHYSESDSGNRTECTRRAEGDTSCQDWLVDSASNSNNPGAWTVSTDVVPGSSWDEGEAGDLNAGQLFTLAEGDNRFIGTQAWSDDPIDGFRFIVPDGYRASVEVSYEYQNLGASEGTAWIWELYSLAVAESCIPDATWAYSCLAPEGSTLITSEILQTPEDYMTPGDWDFVPIDGYILDAGVYQLADNFGFTDNQDSVLSYTFNLRVVAVPQPDGDLNADGQINVADVLIASGIASGLMTASIEQMDHGDVAPLVDSSPAPDGVINAADVLVIQRKALGLVDF